MITIRPLLTSEVPALKEASEADSHGLFFQSHLLRRKGEIVGSFSQSVPVHTVWLDSKKLSGLESFHAIQALDEYLIQTGNARSLSLCSVESPFFPFMARLGKREVFRGALFERLP